MYKKTSELKHPESVCRTEALIWPICYCRIQTSLSCCHRLSSLETVHVGDEISADLRRSRARGRRKLQINLKEKKKTEIKTKKQIRRTVPQETVDMRISSERQQHYDSVVCFFLFSHALWPAPQPERRRVGGVEAATPPPGLVNENKCCDF